MVLYRTCNKGKVQIMKFGFVYKQLAIPYVTAFEEDLTPEVINVIRQPLKEYMNCTLEYAGKVKLCGMETVVSSFYSRDEFPHFCFAIYSLWGKPNKTRTRIPKGSIMKFTFNLNATRRNDNQTKPRHNLPFNPSVLIGIHSPYFLPSPYLEGSIFLGGKAYELRLEMEENTLLPAPYKTNCTDFMKIWRENGGKAPINQMGIVQECRVEEYFRLYECVPRFVDYPHNHTICACGKPEEIGQKDKIKSCDKFQINNKRCIELASDLSQPCQSIKYIVKQEEIDIIKTVRIQEMVTATDMVMTTRSKGHDCSGTNVWTKECSQIDVTILFDKFQITKLTYNPKFEKLELFSVIGGYMGMWLGISLVTIYDKIGDFIGELYSWHKNKKRNKVQEKQSKMYGSNMKPYAKSKDPYHGMW